MKNQALREIVLDLGTDPDDWTENDRRNAAVEQYEQASDYVYDALYEVDVPGLIAALKLEGVMRQAAIGIIVEKTLLNYPIDLIRNLAEDNEGYWLAEDRTARAEQEYDSRVEDKLMRSAS